MNRNELLANLAIRGNGDIYLGVVGPVRSGKSTFIKKFMEIAVIPNITNSEEKKRAIDELPISGEGKTITTMEPKFVPNKGVNIDINGISANIRLVDCVGYITKSCKGYEDENGIRMVKTPWYEDSIPFTEAAKIGTKKVISDHSTIGIVMLSDGSILDIDKEEYLEPSKEIIDELIGINKPFIIIVNTKDINSESAISLVEDLKSKYNVGVIALNVEKMSEEDVDKILKEALYEFPVSNIDVGLDKWVSALDESHWLRKSINNSIKEAMDVCKKIKDMDSIKEVIEENEYVKGFKISDVDTSSGVIKTEVEVNEELYENILNEIIGFDLEDEVELMKVMQEYTKLKKEYGYLKEAIDMAINNGYGVSVGNSDNIEVEIPKIYKQGNRYGVKVKAKSPTLHIIRVDVETSFSPLIGDEIQAKMLVDYLSEGMDVDNKEIFKKEMFGQGMGKILETGINAKLVSLPDATKIKLQNLVNSLANKGKNNLIAVVF